MAFDFFEIPEDVEGALNPLQETHRYRATGVTAVGTAGKLFVDAQALALTPSAIVTQIGTLYRQDVRTKRTGHQQYDCEIPYGTRKQETGDWTWDFDTTGATVHITNAIEEVGRYPAATAPDQKGAIGVDGDQAHGTDIVVPALKINADFRHPAGVITIPQAKFLASITGTTNSVPFLTFDPGEVLFLGSSGKDGTVAESSVRYHFAAESNQSNLTIGDITGIVKKGQHRAWVRYEDEVESAGGSNHPVRVPKFVYIDRVYEETDFVSAFGFGG